MEKCPDRIPYKKADNCIKCKTLLQGKLLLQSEENKKLERDFVKQLEDEIEKMKSDILKLCVSGNPGNAIHRIEEYLK